MKFPTVLEPFRCSCCGEAIYDRNRLKAGEVKVVVCACRRLNLVSAPRRGDTRPTLNERPSTRTRSERRARRLGHYPEGGSIA